MPKKEEKVVGTCALCVKEDVVLELSHIIPKFVPRKLKKDSPSGRMRNPFNPNIPLQDGDKQYLLCGECEDLFNTVETKFCTNIFLPFVNGTLTEFTYDKWLTDFIISISWRTLSLELEDWKANTDIREVNREAFIRKEQVMRDYLLGKRDNLYNIENHIFFFNDILEAHGIPVQQIKLHSFFRHSFVSYSVWLEDGCYVVTNLLGLVLVTILKKSKKDNWKFTQVNKLGSFDIKTPQYIESMVFGDLFDLAKDSNEAGQQISDAQKQKIVDSLKSNPDKFLSSSNWDDIQKDKELEK